MLLRLPLRDQQVAPRPVCGAKPQISRQWSWQPCSRIHTDEVSDW